MEIRNLFGEMKHKIVGKKLRIVFPEGKDERVVRAARLKFEGLAEPIILGVPTEVHNLLTEFGFSNPGITVIDPNNYANFETMKQEFLNLRKERLMRLKLTKSCEMSTISVLCWFSLAWLKGWFLERCTLLLIPFVRPFKSSRLNQV